jgi:hypothetical protein
MEVQESTQAGAAPPAPNLKPKSTLLELTKKIAFCAIAVIAAYSQPITFMPVFVGSMALTLNLRRQGVISLPEITNNSHILEKISKITLPLELNELIGSSLLLSCYVPGLKIIVMTAWIASCAGIRAGVEAYDHLDWDSVNQACLDFRKLVHIERQVLEAAHA